MQKKTEKQMTNTQKAGDAVRMVADEIKEARKNLSKLSPKKHLENAGRVSGAVLLWLMEYTMRIANGVVLDNFALRATERRFKNKNEDGFAKRNPAFASHMLYYMIPLLTWLGVETADFAKERVQERKQKEEEEARKKAMSFDNFKINPNVSNEEWEKQINAIQPYVISHLFLTEGYVQDLYYDNGKRGTKTIGAGFTVDDEVHRKFAKKILGRPIVNGLSVSVEEARVLADAWTREMIYPKMKEAFNVSLDAKLFITLVVAAYNAGESTYSIKGNTGIPVRDAVNAGKTIEEIIEWSKTEVDKFATYFYADNLDFFKLSGRVGNFSAIMGTLFGVHPVLTMNSEGKMMSVTKCKGKNKTLQKLVDYVVELGEDVENHRVIIGHTDALPIAKQLANMIEEKLGKKLPIEYVVVNPTAGSHCGPDTIGVCFHAIHR